MGIEQTSPLTCSITGSNPYPKAERAVHPLAQTGCPHGPCWAILLEATWQGCAMLSSEPCSGAQQSLVSHPLSILFPQTSLQ